MNWSLQRLFSLAFVLATCLLTRSASAEIITFSGLGDFSNYSESGMNMVSSSVWNWPGAQMAHMDDGTASFTLASSANFNLTSVDMIATGGTGPARFSAFLDGNLLGFVDVPFNAAVFAFPALFQNIDEFRVTVPSSHFTFDNVVFSPAVATVPEPASMLVWALAAGAACITYRRRHSTPQA